MKTLVLLRGKPGTGKSTLSNALGHAMHAAVIDKDDVKDVLDARYRDEYIGGLTYEVMLRIAERCLAAGVSVICDSCLTYPDLHDRAVEIATRHGASIRVIRTVCTDREAWESRLAARGSWPNHRIKSLEESMARANERYEVADELVLDTARPFENVVRDALAHCVIFESA